ncbi:MAG: transglycosylase SLT domain-containing protein [Nitrospirae bacterium]|nr:transglycosylase SLT domain-containing protein [Nitrospirota bacterium]
MIIIILLLYSTTIQAYVSKRHKLPDIARTDRALFIIGSSDRLADILRDYREYLIAVRLYHVKENRNSIRLIDSFLREFPHSYLSRDAQWLKILNYLDLAERGELGKRDSLQFRNLLETYTARYSDDEDVLFIKSLYTDRSAREYQDTIKRLYLMGGEYFDYLDGMSLMNMLSSDEAVALARTLIKKIRYNEALSFIQRALKRWDTRELRLLLAETYFRMKDYEASAEEYKKAGDLYRAAISYKRADLMDKFEKLYRAVTKEKTPEACNLILTKSDELRRQGRPEETLKLLRQAYRSGYPCKEDLLWMISWTEYRMGNFLSASYNLRNLYRKYGKDKYLYWLIRSMEEMGRPSRGLYDKLNGNSFYALLLDKKNTFAKVSYTHKTHDVSIDDMGSLNNEEIEYSIKRAKLLSKLGLNSFAVEELRAAYVRLREKRLPLCREFLDLKQYYEAMKCVVGLDSEASMYIKYPVAYWDEVVRVSEEKGIDPLLLLSIMREESRFNEQALSVSGALGLMQLMPFTARWIADITGFEGELTTEKILKPEVNITLSANYLKRLLDEFNSVALAVAAYNAGEGSVRRWLSEQSYEGLDEFIEDIPYNQTYHYVKKVLSSYANYVRIYRGE